MAGRQKKGDGFTDAAEVRFVEAQAAPATGIEAHGEEICRGLSAGEPLAEICRRLNIGRSTVYEWIKKDPAFADEMEQARRDGFDAIAYRVRRTARGKTEEQGGDSTGDVQRDKLIIETDLKLLAKWHPAAYGDRVAVDHSGGLEIKGDPSPEEVAARLAAILEVARRRRDSQGPAEQADEG